MNLPELHICNRIPVYLYQSKMTTGIRKLLPLKLNLVSIIKGMPLLTFTASCRNRKGEGKDEVKM